MVPHTTALEPFSECMLLGMLVAWATSFLFQWDAFVVYLLHLLLWFLLDWMLLSIVQNGLLPFSKWEFVVAWTFRECGALYLYLNALWDPTIRWRQRDLLTRTTLGRHRRSGQAQVLVAPPTATPRNQAPPRCRTKRHPTHARPPAHKQRMREPHTSVAPPQRGQRERRQRRRARSQYAGLGE
uniref:Putative glct-1 n=1 Tax=Ixodes ricinus TaxID=34613 RepID=V5IDB2_IXORI